MDFLSKIRQHLSGSGNKEFRKQVLEEKKQKYLFSDDLTDKYRSSRSGFFKDKRRAIAPYTNQFSEALNETKKKFEESHILAYIGILLLALSAYIIFLSPYFRLSPSRVLLEARNEGIDVSVAYRAIEDLYGTNLFWLDEEKVAIILKKSLKNLAHVSIDKLYPSGLKVLMTSMPITYEATIYGFDKRWQMSSNGVLLPHIQKAEGSTGGLLPMMIISDSLRGEVVFDYKQVIGDSNMLLIEKILELFRVEWPDISITQIRYFSRENELHITTKNNTTILLTLESESRGQDYAAHLDSIKNQLIGLRTYIDKNKQSLLDDSTIYIDARIIKKVFVCKQKDTCKNNLIRIYGETYK